MVTFQVISRKSFHERFSTRDHGCTGLKEVIHTVACKASFRPIHLRLLRLLTILHTAEKASHRQLAQFVRTFSEHKGKVSNFLEHCNVSNNARI